MNFPSTKARQHPIYKPHRRFFIDWQDSYDICDRCRLYRELRNQDERKNITPINPCICIVQRQLLSSYSLALLHSQPRLHIRYHIRTPHTFAYLCLHYSRPLLPLPSKPHHQPYLEIKMDDVILVHMGHSLANLSHVGDA